MSTHTSSPRYESSSSDASKLGEPIHFPFSNRTAPNRFLKAAMTERLSSWDPQDHSSRGVPSKQLINLYKRWGEGEIGLILTGNIMIFPDQLEAPANPIIPLEDNTFSGERFDAFKALATESKKHGSLIVGQVSHPGRQVIDKIQSDPVSASDVHLEGNVMGMTFAKPHAATQEEIDRIVAGFAHAAEYLQKAGYDGIELHGAHGYLLAQFLSSTTNKRTDSYGGSISNRARIILDIAREIRKRVDDTSFVLGIKLNSVEFQEGGFSPEEAKELCTLLEKEKFDFVELSGGTYEKLAFGHQRESTKKREGFFLEFAEMIVPAIKQTKVYITGGFKSVGAMVSALDTVDGVGLGRPIAQEPRICKDILSGAITGAIKQAFDENDFGTGNFVAGTQMRQVSKDQEPFDASSEENLNGFKKDMGKFMEEMGKDTQGKKSGYIDLESLKASPYGTVEA